MTHLQRRIQEDYILNIWTRLLWPKMKTKDNPRFLLPTLKPNPLMLWESFEIPDTILLALWVRIMGAEEWQLHQQYVYTQFGFVRLQMPSFAFSLHLLPEPECWLLTIAMISIRPVSCTAGRHCAVIGFTMAWHDEYLPDLFVTGYRHSLIQFTVFSSAGVELPTMDHYIQDDNPPLFFMQ